MSLGIVIENIASERIFIDSIIEVSTGGPSGITSMTPVVVDKYAIVDTAAAHEDGSPGVLIQFLPTEPFIEFDVYLGSKYRVGMTIHAYSSAGDSSDFLDSNKNLVPQIIECVKNKCTVGEICDVIKNKYGAF